MKHGKRKHISTVRLTGLFVCVALLPAFGCGQTSGRGGTGDGKTIRIVTSVDQYYGYVAVQAHKKLGTWEGSGLNVEVVSGTTPTLGQLLASGEGDIGLGTPQTEAAVREQGVKQTIVASCITPWDYYVIVSNKGDFPDADNLRELKGANFGITGRGSPGDYLLHKFATERLGWGPGAYKQTAMGDVSSLFAALSSGKVDAVLWAPDQAYIGEQKGYATSFRLPKIEESVLQSFSVMDDFMDENPKAVRAFFEYYFKEIRELQRNPQEFINVLVNDWGYSNEVARRLAENNLPLLSTNGRITEAQLTGIANAIPYLTGKPESEPPKVMYKPWQAVGK